MHGADQRNARAGIHEVASARLVALLRQYPEHATYAASEMRPDARRLGCRPRAGGRTGPGPPALPRVPEQRPVHGRARVGAEVGLITRTLARSTRRSWPSGSASPSAARSILLPDPRGRAAHRQRRCTTWPTWPPAASRAPRGPGPGPRALHPGARDDRAHRAGAVAFGGAGARWPSWSWPAAEPSQPAPGCSATWRPCTGAPSTRPPTGRRELRERAPRSASCGDASDEMSRAARIDPLTGLGNRRALDEWMRRPGRRTRRGVRRRRPLQAGQRHVLPRDRRPGPPGRRRACSAPPSAPTTGWPATAATSSSSSAPAAAPAPEPSPNASTPRVRDHDWTQLADGLHVTISVGVTPGIDGGDPLALADAALYRAKRGGRNQVAVAAG